jgi:hypothetical protein
LQRIPASALGGASEWLRPVPYKRKAGLRLPENCWLCFSKHLVNQYFSFCFFIGYGLKTGVRTENLVSVGI